MLDVRRLRVLAAAARSRSFAGAAAELGYTPAAISQQIAALEREAGVRLFSRHARGAEPTDAGRLLLRHADAVLAQLAAAERELEAHRESRRSCVRIAAFAAAWKTLVPRAVRRLRERDPELEIVLENAEPEASIPALCRGELDLAVVYEPNEAPPPTDDLHRDHLADHRLYVVLPRTHPLASRSPTSRTPRGSTPATTFSTRPVPRPASSRMSSSRAVTTRPSKASSLPARRSRSSR